MLLNACSAAAAACSPPTGGMAQPAVGPPLAAAVDLVAGGEPFSFSEVSYETPRYTTVCASVRHNSSVAAAVSNSHIGVTVLQHFRREKQRGQTRRRNNFILTCSQILSLPSPTRAPNNHGIAAHAAHCIPCVGNRHNRSHVHACKSSCCNKQTPTIVQRPRMELGEGEGGQWEERQQRCGRSLADCLPSKLLCCGRRSNCIGIIWTASTLCCKSTDT